MPGHHGSVGALVTLELPEDSPLRSLPWVITFGPLGEEEDWDPVVCGPYERQHALRLAEAVVADEDLVAVVEPMLPCVTVDEIRDEIAAARSAADEEAAEEEGGRSEGGRYGHDAAAEGRAAAEVVAPPAPGEIRAGFGRIAARLTGAAG
jgi:hypothetical protein